MERNVAFYALSIQMIALYAPTVPFSFHGLADRAMALLHKDACLVDESKGICESIQTRWIDRIYKPTSSPTKIDKIRERKKNKKNRERLREREKKRRAGILAMFQTSSREPM